MTRGDPTSDPSASLDPSYWVGDKIIISSLVSIILAFIFVCMRLLTKFFVTHTPGWDDYTSVLALGFAIARVVGNFLEVYKNQVGHHVWDVNPKFFQSVLNWLQIDDVLYLAAVMFAKLSILLLYLRLFKTRRLFKWLCWAMCVLVVGYCVSLGLTILFLCSPEGRTWNFNIPGHCIEIGTIDIVIGGFNIFTDSVLLVMPITMIYNLNMPMRRLIGLGIVFATGIFVVATSIIREVIVVRTLKDVDQTVSIVDDIMWLTLEVNTGIICGCLPVIPPLLYPVTSSKYFNSSSSFRSLLSRIRSSRSRSGNSDNIESLGLRDKAEYVELGKKSSKDGSSPSINMAGSKVAGECV